MNQSIGKGQPHQKRQYQFQYHVHDVIAVNISGFYPVLIAEQHGRKRRCRRSRNGTREHKDSHNGNQRGGINPGLQAVGCHHRLKDHADHQGIADIRQHTADDQKHGAEDKRAHTGENRGKDGI